MLSDLVVCYLFCGGAGAGLCLVLCVLGLFSPRDCVATGALSCNSRAFWRFCAPDQYRRLFFPGFVLSFALMTLGMMCLLLDLADIDRVVLLFVSPQLSYIAVGAWALVACLLFAALLCLAWGGFGTWSDTVVRVLEVLGGVLALVVMVYTGLLLQSLESVPLWSTSWLPVLFVASSLSCGLACVLVVAQFSGAAYVFGSVLRWLAACDVVVIGVEAIVVVAFVMTALGFGSQAASGTTLAAADSIRELIEGSQAWLFWGGFVLAGMAVPLVLDVFLVVRHRMMPGVGIFAGAGVLVGGFVMRFCIVGAGMHPLLIF